MSLKALFPFYIILLKIAFYLSFNSVNPFCVKYGFLINYLFCKYNFIVYYRLIWFSYFFGKSINFKIPLVYAVCFFISTAEFVTLSFRLFGDKLYLAAVIAIVCPVIAVIFRIFIIVII